jgi:Tol biopolymer transport system component
MLASSELRSYGNGSGGRALTRLGMALAIVSGLSIWMLVIPAWSGASQTTSPENGRIVFRRWLNDVHTRGDIFTINPDGTGLYRVTRTPKAASTEPSPSPNGRWIVYMVIHHGNLDFGRLFKIRPNGSAKTKLEQTCNGDCQGDGFPDWSTTGLIAFQRTLSLSPTAPTGFHAIFVMRSNGTGARQITQIAQNPAVGSPYDDVAPGWSPSGKRLAFERINNSTGHHAIFIVALNGKGLHRITPWWLDASQPQYSPHGRWIAFRSDETSDTSGNIWLVHRDGSGLHKLTHTKAGTGKWASCAFSPDGKYVVSAKSLVKDGEAQNADVYVISLSGGAPQSVTNDPNHWDSAPDWGIGRA